MLTNVHPLPEMPPHPRSHQSRSVPHQPRAVLPITKSFDKNSSNSARSLNKQNGDRKYTVFRSEGLRLHVRVLRWYFATANTSGLTFQSGADVTVRGNFVNGGALPNSQDTNYRPINQQYPVFGYAIDLGNVGSDSQSALFQLSLHQQNCVQFQGENGIVSKLPCMWTNYFSADTAAVCRVRSLRVYISDLRIATILLRRLQHRKLDGI